MNLDPLRLSWVFRGMVNLIMSTLEMASYLGSQVAKRPHQAGTDFRPRQIQHRGG